MNVLSRNKLPSGKNISTQNTFNICICRRVLNHAGKMTAMETHDLNKGINVSAYKISLAKQLEENAKRLKEHYQKVQSQYKEIENQKQEITSFVCDWQ
jgi:hypothetical protein